MNTALKFVNRDKNTFLPTLKARVDAYFTEKNISKYADTHMVFKTVFFLALTVILYVLLISSLAPLPVQLLLSLLIE